MNISFYCNKCGKEQDLELGDSPSNCHRDVLSTGEAYFWARCVKCGSKTVRYITEARIDPYYLNSPKLRKQRREMKNDLLQPGEYGFKTMYPAQWKMIEQAEQVWRASSEARKTHQLEFLKRHRHNVEERRAAEKVVEAEERLRS